MLKRAQSLQDYLEILWRRKWSFLIPFVLVSILGTVFAYILPNIYRSSTMIFVEPQKVPEAYVKPTITASVEDRLKTITQQIMSRTRLESIIGEFELYRGKNTPQMSEWEKWMGRLPFLGVYWNTAPLNREAAVQRMRQDIEVDFKGDKIFTISYQGLDPELTMQVTDKLASFFIEENLRIREQQAESTTEFLENELEQIRLVLEEKEQRIKDFKQRFMGELPEQLEANLRALDRFQLELKSTEEGLKALENRQASIERLLGDAQQEGQPERSALATRLEDLKTQLSLLQAKYREDYPDIALIQQEIQQVQAALAKERENPRPSTQAEVSGGVRDPVVDSLLSQMRETKLEIARHKNRQEVLNQQIKEYEKRVEDTPLREQQLMTILRDYDNIKHNYESLLNKRLDAKISENLEKRQKGEIFKVLDPANLPLSPYKPDRLQMVLFGILLAAACGGGLALLREQMDQTFISEEELSEAMELPVLTAISHQPVLGYSRVLNKNRVARDIYHPAGREP